VSFWRTFACISKRLSSVGSGVLFEFLRRIRPLRRITLDYVRTKAARKKCVRVHAPRPRRGGCFTISIRIIRAASIRAYLWCVYQPFSLSHRRRHFNHIRCSHPRYVEIFCCCCCASVNVGQCRDHPSIKRRRRFSHVLSLLGRTLTPRHPTHSSGKWIERPAIRAHLKFSSLVSL
jgi:hypothetical protein